MNKPKKPFVPGERLKTVRKEIISILEGRPLSAKEISGIVKVGEKEVYEHLGHIQKATSKDNRHLIIFPAKCKSCGFVFRKREKLKKPSRCPICHNESIQEPLFSI